MTFEEYQNKIENQERAGETLTALMENIAHKTQLELVENFGANAADILDKKNCINMRSFLKKSGGELSKEEVKHDEKLNQEKELAWSGATNEGVRKYYKEKFGYDTTDELLHQYRTDKLKHKGTIVGDQIFPVKIYSQGDVQTALDWRRKPKFNDFSVKMEVTKLPVDIENMIYSFMKKMSLNYGCIDMIVKPSGEYVFLEVNSNGQWYFIQLNTGAQIAKAIANQLVGNK